MESFFSGYRPNNSDVGVSSIALHPREGRRRAPLLPAPHVVQDVVLVALHLQVHTAQFEASL